MVFSDLKDSSARSVRRARDWRVASSKILMRLDQAMGLEAS